MTDKKLFGVSVKFSGSNGVYTYLYDPYDNKIRKGDKIDVPVRGQGRKTVTVVATKVPRSTLNGNIKYTILENIVQKDKEEELKNHAKVLARNTGVVISPNIESWMKRLLDPNTRDWAKNAIRQAVDHKIIKSEELRAFYSGLLTQEL